LLEDGYDLGRDLIREIYSPPPRLEASQAFLAIEAWIDSGAMEWIDHPPAVLEADEVIDCVGDQPQHRRGLTGSHHQV
jgi:hypothetical protein